MLVLFACINSVWAVLCKRKCKNNISIVSSVSVHSVNKIAFEKKNLQSYPSQKPLRIFREWPVIDCQTYFGNAGSRNIYKLFNWGRNDVILAIVLQLMILSWLWMKVLIEANDLCQQLSKFIVVGIDTSDLRKFVQTPQHSLDLFQNRAFMSMMNSK